MGALTVTPNCTLLCACGAAYDINPLNGQYTPDQVFSPVADFAAPGPAVINNSSGDEINACLVGKNPEGIIVAFRGTLPPGTPDSLPDWLQDFFAEPISYNGLPGKVHSGFLDAVNSVISGVINAVKALDPVTNPVIVTGHSKGGAMASITALLLVNAGISVKQVITFASPKPGDAAFQAGYEKIIPNQIRYENYGDLIPLLPPADAFISGLADVLALIPDIGQRLAALVRSAAGWNYEAVGSELFIESAENNYTVNPNESIFEQVGDFALNLTENLLDPLTALGDAHTVQCGYGYMSGTCPASVCLVRTASA